MRRPPRSSRPSQARLRCRHECQPPSPMLLNHAPSVLSSRRNTAGCFAAAAAIDQTWRAGGSYSAGVGNAVLSGDHNGAPDNIYRTEVARKGSSIIWRGWHGASARENALASGSGAMPRCHRPISPQSKRSSAIRSALSRSRRA
jgi:hypothetical protein